MEGQTLEEVLNKHNKLAAKSVQPIIRKYVTAWNESKSLEVEVEKSEKEKLLSKVDEVEQKYAELVNFAP